MFRSRSNTASLAAMSPGSCVHHCLRHTVSLAAVLLLLAILVNANQRYLDDDYVDDEVMALDKRPARLSYFRAPYGGGGGGGSYSRGRYNPYASSDGYGSHSNGGGYDWWRKKAVYRHNMPWENLPNTNCLRQFCRSDNDCCRRYSKCNEEARVCYDCWYGHPCSTNSDCCERFPVCNPALRTCRK